MTAPRVIRCTPPRLALVLLVPALCTVLGGCDCWGTLETTVKIESAIPTSSGARLYVVQVAKIRDSDVTGTDELGLPQGDGSHVKALTFELEDGVVEYVGTDDLVSPYPTYSYAYIDANENGVLDSQDPFGVAATNPIDVDCDAYATTISLDQIYP